MQIKQILVPVDLAPLSRLALNHAIAIARKFNARLTLLHVVESSVSPILPAEEARIEKQHYQQSRRMLPALIPPEDRKDLNIRTMVKVGRIDEQILTAMNERHVDLVVMGTHGRGLFGTWLIGSVTNNVLQKTNIPILTVCRVTRPLAFGRILLATSLDEPSIESLRFATNLAKMVHASVVAVHAVEVGVEGGAEAAVYLTADRMQEAREQMETFRAASGLTDIETVVIDGPAADSVLATAQEEAADLIAITIPRDGSVTRNDLGSTAEKIIREAHVPVLAIPAKEKAREHSSFRAA
jgi:nucleotide-binding universal stress UspA family protein